MSDLRKELQYFVYHCTEYELKMAAFLYANSTSDDINYNRNRLYAHISKADNVRLQMIKKDIDNSFDTPY